MFRLLYTLIIAAGAIFGIHWLNNKNPHIKEWAQIAEDFIKEHLDTGDFLTLEEHFTPEQILTSHKSDLLKGPNYQFIDATQVFFPYLILEVKYANENLTEKGFIIWGMEDGEIVLNTDDWKKTSGFQDIINADISHNEFKVINTLAVNNGLLDQKHLQQELQADNDLIDSWIDNLHKKQLVIKSDNKYHLHLYRPNLNVKPNTQIKESLVAKQYKGSKRVPSRYSKSQIAKTAQATFGSHFAIRNITEVFLPVYAMRVQNPDGSIMTSYWNALNDSQMNDILVF